MQLVIADTGPINCLILIGQIEILPALFESVILPLAVKVELDNPGTPPPVRNWIVDPPAWVKVRHMTSDLFDDALKELGPGETEAIVLTVELHADLLLMDERRGVTGALRKGLSVTGTVLRNRAAWDCWPAPQITAFLN